MKIVKGILLGLGVVFVLILALLLFIADSSADFEAKHRDFILTFTKDFAKNWKTADVFDRVSNDFVVQSSTPAAKQAISLFVRAGDLVELSELELSSYMSGTDGETATFTLRAVFSNAEGIATISIHADDDDVKVNGFHLNFVDLPILQDGKTSA